MSTIVLVLTLFVGDMTMRPIPKMTRQKRGNKVYAVVRVYINGKQKMFYLGEYGSEEAEKKYHEIAIAYYNTAIHDTSKNDMTLAYLYNQFLDTIEGRKDSESNNLRRSIRYAVECFGDSLTIGDFADDTRSIGILTRYQQYLTSIALETREDDGADEDDLNKPGRDVVQKVKRQWTYTGVNLVVKKWICVLRWGCRQGILPFNLFRVLDALKPLTSASGLPRTQEAEAVDDETLLAVMPFMTPTVREMVQIQRGTGMRAKEVCDLLVGDIDTTGVSWIVATNRHKTSNFLKTRYFAFSEAETEILRKRIAGKNPDDHVFSQRENFAELWTENRKKRKTPVYKQEREHQERIVDSRLERYHTYFTERSYAQSIRTACGRARRAGIDVKDFAPKSIRHAAYTEYSAKYGVEMASKNAGHTSPRMADVYDHSLRIAAQRIAADRGLFGAE